MNEKNFWNTRYAERDYFYGAAPNTFLVDQLDQLTGPVLSLCEGEGRNAVFLAKNGLSVLGVDISDVALAKAHRLAEQAGVSIDTQLADLAAYQPAPETYGAIVSIFAHLPSVVRDSLYPQLEKSLKPGGVLLLEAYSEHQLQNTTGGPKELDLLMTKSKLLQAFPNLEPVLIQELDRQVVEGKGHTGMASVVQFIGRKPC